MTTVFVYDAGALVAADRGDKRMAALHRHILATSDAPPVVPVVVLAQVWRGGPQPLLSRLLKDCEIAPDTESVGRIAGRVCTAARTSDVVDGIVVAIALAMRAGVITSDPDDLRHLAGAIGRRLATVVV